MYRSTCFIRLSKHHMQQTHTYVSSPTIFLTSQYSILNFLHFNHHSRFHMEKDNNLNNLFLFSFYFFFFWLQFDFCLSSKLNVIKRKEIEKTAFVLKVFMKVKLLEFGLIYKNCYKKLL